MWSRSKTIDSSGFLICEAHGVSHKFLLPEGCKRKPSAKCSLKWKASDAAAMVQCMQEIVEHNSMFACKFMVRKKTKCMHPLPVLGFGYWTLHNDASSESKIIHVCSVQKETLNPVRVMSIVFSDYPDDLKLWKRKLKQVLKAYSYQIELLPGQEISSGPATLHITPRFLILTRTVVESYEKLYACALQSKSVQVHIFGGGESVRLSLASISGTVRCDLYFQTRKGRRIYDRIFSLKQDKVCNLIEGCGLLPDVPVTPGRTGSCPLNMESLGISKQAFMTPSRDSSAEVVKSTSVSRLECDEARDDLEKGRDVAENMEDDLQCDRVRRPKILQNRTSTRRESQIGGVSSPSRSPTSGDPLLRYVSIYHQAKVPLVHRPAQASTPALYSYENVVCNSTSPMDPAEFCQPKSSQDGLLVVGSELAVGGNRDEQPHTSSPCLDKATVELSVSVFADWAICGEPWSLAVVFIKSPEDGTFEKIRNLEEASGHHLLLPFRHVNAVGDLNVSFDGIDESKFQLISQGNQVIYYADVRQLKHLNWIVVEYHFKHIGGSRTTKFLGHLKVDNVEGCSSVRSSLLSLSANVTEVFQPHAWQAVTTGVSPKKSRNPCFTVAPLSPIDRRIFCQLMDPQHPLDKDWAWFAGLMGLEQHDIRVISGNRHSSHTELALQVIEERFPDKCRASVFEQALMDMHRLDAVECLHREVLHSS